MRDRRGEILFIDARKLGTMVDRTHRELTDEDIAAHYGYLPRLAMAKNASDSIRGRGRFLQECASVDEVQKHGSCVDAGAVCWS